MTGHEPSPLRAWAASGAMALTGRPYGPPRAAPGRAAARVSAALSRFGELSSSRTGLRPSLPGVEVLGERAAVAGLTRRGPRSCGGAFRTLRTRDGWLGLSLPRADDLDLIPALTEREPRDADPWDVVTGWARTTETAFAAERIALLGLAGSAVPADGLNSRAGVEITESGTRRHKREQPVVLDLTALWAGPLCAHLLATSGARVIKVESRSRPDGARFGPPPFFDLLHAGHAMVALDLHDDRDLDALRALIAGADLVLESSRARALRQLGIDADACVAAGTSWLSLTARGRASNAIGFGDDIAAAAGLVVPDGDDLLPCGDALADPLTGVCAAEAAAEALLADRARLVDVSMLHLTAEIALGTPEEHVVRRTDDGWWIESADGRFPVSPPTARPPSGRAGTLGADNTELLGAQRSSEHDDE
ncbi:CoA transferase [Nocardia sp. BMG51109]|uniref:CoA transferase n=1 Tax=Nocardia sp. BMG51109 TaxID=1056816 RepID=UPI000463C1AA|nr:CoA transferase [Nocardia sp. BMG51109]